MGGRLISSEIVIPDVETKNKVGGNEMPKRLPPCHFEGYLQVSYVQVTNRYM